MRSRDEVLREFGSSQCILGDKCVHQHCRAEMAMADEIVRLRDQLAAVEKEVEVLRGFKERQEQRAAWEYHQSLINYAQRAERERDEARRALAVLAPMFDPATKEGEGMMAVGLELMRLNKELTEEREAVASFIAQNRALRTRAKRAERVVEAVAELAQCDVVAGGDYYDDVVVMPVLAAYHRYALDAEAQP